MITIWKNIYFNTKKSDYIISSNGDIMNKNTRHVLKKYYSDGFLKVSLTKNDGITHTSYNVALLMLITFKNITIKSDYIIYFRDGNRYNLNIDNIDYISLNEYKNKMIDNLFIIFKDYFILKSGGFIDEKWKIIKNPYDDTNTSISISNYGRFLNILTLNMLNPSITSSSPYPIISFKIYNRYKGTEVTKKYSVHRLVAEYFVENDDPDHNTIVNHKDENKLNYYYKNLEWTTPSNNSLYSLRQNGSNKNKGEDHKNSTINNEIAEKICYMISNGFRISEIVNTLNVSRNVVRHIREGKTWKDISSKYSMNYTGKYFISPATKELIRCLIDEGMSNKDINKETGVGITSINIIRKKMINEFEYKKEKVIESLILIDYYNKMPINDIAKMRGLQKSYIEQVINMHALD